MPLADSPLSLFLLSVSLSLLLHLTCACSSPPPPCSLLPPSICSLPPPSPPSSCVRGGLQLWPRGPGWAPSPCLSSGPSRGRSRGTTPPTPPSPWFLPRAPTAAPPPSPPSTRCSSSSNSSNNNNRSNNNYYNSSSSYSYNSSSNRCSNSKRLTLTEAPLVMGSTQVRSHHLLLATVLRPSCVC